MKIIIEKTVTEEIEIAVPCFRKYAGCCYHVTDTAVIIVRDYSISKWENTQYGDVSFKNRVSEASAGAEITEAEFDAKYNEVIASFRNDNKLTVAV